MLNDLLLLSGNDIPFIEAGMVMHPPKIKEIALIGEDTFFTGCGVLNFSKDILSQEDKINLADKSNFEILMSIIMDKSHPVMQKNRVSALMVLSLLFPNYEIELTPQGILLKNWDEVHSINSNNFEKFKEIMTAMFCLKGRGDSSNETYNPAGEAARRIAEKLQKRKEVLAEQKGEQKIAILGRYVSILAVGEKKDMNDLMNYTIYQLFDEYERFELKEQFDLNMKARLAGARDLEDAENWTKDLHN